MKIFKWLIELSELFHITLKKMLVKNLVKKDNAVLILGAAGKSGVLCAYEARKQAGPNGKIIGIIHHDTRQAELEALNNCDHIMIGNAKNPMEIYIYVYVYFQN
jgi:hypothetical protein